MRIVLCDSDIPKTGLAPVGVVSATNISAEEIFVDDKNPTAVIAVVDKKRLSNLRKFWALSFLSIFMSPLTDRNKNVRPKL